jgi:hypothetical protein
MRLDVHNHVLRLTFHLSPPLPHLNYKKIAHDYDRITIEPCYDTDMPMLRHIRLTCCKITMSP